MADEAYKEKLRSLRFGNPQKRGVKVTKDELGNVTKEHWNDRVDVQINAPHVKIVNSVQEMR